MYWAAEGVKTKQIATRLGHSKRAIRMHHCVLKSLPPNATLPPPKAGSGRPSKTNLIQDLRLKKYVKKFPFKSARELKNKVQGWRDVSVRTIQERQQKRMGLPSCRVTKKSLLTEAMKRKQLAFAKKYRSWTASEWINVMYSDALTFSLVNLRSVMVRQMCR
jgi:hypothetical protein